MNPEVVKTGHKYRYKPNQIHKVGKSRDASQMWHRLRRSMIDGATKAREHSFTWQIHILSETLLIYGQSVQWSTALDVYRFTDVPHMLNYVLVKLELGPPAGGLFYLHSFAKLPWHCLIYGWPYTPAPCWCRPQAGLFLTQSPTLLASLYMCDGVAHYRSRDWT